MRTALFSFMVCVAAYGAECIQVGDTPKGRILVSGFDMINAEIQSIEAELLESTTQRVLQKAIKGQFEDVPWGQYSVRVHAPGFLIEKRDIRLEQPELPLRFQLTVGGGCRSYSTVSGSVARVGERHSLWLKIIPVRGVGGTETPIRPDGKFTAAGVGDGEYIIAVLDGASVLHSQAATISRDTTLSIRLPRASTSKQ